MWARGLSVSKRKGNTLVMKSEGKTSLLLFVVSVFPLIHIKVSAEILIV